MFGRSAVLLIALAFVASAQPARTASAVIFGTVGDTGMRPIAGAGVSFAGSNVRASTDSLGRFQVVSVPAGKFILIVRNIGFRPATEQIDVAEGDTLRLAFTLVQAMQEFATVLVTERGVSQRLKEFDERRRRGFGEFFTQADIEQINPVKIGDVLRRSLGIRVTSSGDTAVSSRYGCVTPIYLDGIALGPISLKHLPSPNEIAAIEVYAGTANVPIWLPNGPLNSNKGCGAILLWTRDGSS